VEHARPVKFIIVRVLNAQQGIARPGKGLQDFIKLSLSRSLKARLGVMDDIAMVKPLSRVWNIVSNAAGKWRTALVATQTPSPAPTRTASNG
jgi:hypothetical protein